MIGIDKALMAIEILSLKSQKIDIHNKNRWGITSEYIAV